MYDNTDLTLSTKSCPEVEFLKFVPQHLTNVTNYGNNKFGEYVTGYLDNLKVSITENRVKIYDSSLCKYYLGNNFKTLTIRDTKKAIEKISDCLQLPFDLANVTRIDFAQNMILNHDPSLYLKYLGIAQYYNRLEQNNGLYYNNQKRQLVFYDKVHEQKIKHQPIPELYRNKNVLRYELRFRKQLRKQFNRNSITAGLLYDEVFYYDLVKRWEREYLSIQKINSKLGSMVPTGSIIKLVRNLALYSIIELGQSNVLNKIKEWQRTGLITKKQANDMRIIIKQISSTPLTENGNELITEMDRKIKEAVQTC